MENKKKDLKAEPIYEHQEVSRSTKTKVKKGKGKFTVESQYVKSDKWPIFDSWSKEGWRTYRKYDTAKQAQEALKGLKKHGYDFVEYRLGF